MTRPVLLLLFSGMFLSMKCLKETADCHYGLWLNNQSDRNVYAVYSFDYPDTSITFQNPALNPITYVEAHQKKVFFSGNSSCLESQLDRFKVDTLSIFIFDVDLIQSTSWSQVRQNYQVLKRYDYSLDDLRNTNFSIDFP